MTRTTIGPSSLLPFFLFFPSLYSFTKKKKATRSQEGATRTVAALSLCSVFFSPFLIALHSATFTHPLKGPSPKGISQEQEYTIYCKFRIQTLKKPLSFNDERGTEITFRIRNQSIHTPIYLNIYIQTIIVL